MPLPSSAAVPSPRAITAALAAAATTWLLLLVAAPYLVSHARPGTGWFDAGGLVYLVGHLICHQRADRSFHAWGVQLPVCARCTGLYAGAVGGALFVVWRSWVRRGIRPGRKGTPTRVPRWGPRPPGTADRLPTYARTEWRRFLLVAALPTAVSVGLEIGRIWAQSPAVRAVAAIPLGFTVACFVAVHAADLIPSMRRRPCA